MPSSRQRRSTGRLREPRAPFGQFGPPAKPTPPDTFPLVLRRLAIVAAALLVAGCASQEQHSASVEPPVVVLVLDEFPTDSLLTPSGEIDAARYPNFAALARMSTWFPNAYTVYDSTFKSVPAILDGVMPVDGTAADQRSHNANVYRLMHRHGYAVVDVESASALCPDTICPGSRIRRPGVLARLAGSGRPARLHAWIGAIRRRERPTFYFQHTLLPHGPWIYLPSGRAMRPPGKEQIRNANRWPSFDERGLTRQNELRHLLQVGYVDREIGRLLRRLRQTRLLRRALLVVVADHGQSFDVGVNSRRRATDANVEEIAPVPFFVKLPNQETGRRDPALARTLDVVPTIADVLGVRVPWRHDGISVFSRITSERREVQLPKRDFDGIVTISAEEIEKRRARRRAHRSRIFGTGRQSIRRYGDPWAAAYRIGPNRSLLGRRAAPLTSGFAAVGAQVHPPGLVRRVPRGRSEVAPTLVTGELTGALPGSVRDLAVAVNGRVAAVSRSFHLMHPEHEYFSLLFPESALRKGVNRLELFEVRDGRTLAPIAP